MCIESHDPQRISPSLRWCCKNYKKIFIIQHMHHRIHIQKSHSLSSTSSSCSSMWQSTVFTVCITMLSRLFFPLRKSLCILYGSMNPDGTICPFFSKHGAVPVKKVTWSWGRYYRKLASCIALQSWHSQSINHLIVSLSLSPIQQPTIHPSAMEITFWVTGGKQAESITILLSDKNLLEGPPHFQRQQQPYHSSSSMSFITIVV